MELMFSLYKPLITFFFAFDFRHQLKERHDKGEEVSGLWHSALIFGLTVDPYMTVDLVVK